MLAKGVLEVSWEVELREVMQSCVQQDIVEVIRQFGRLKWREARAWLCQHETSVVALLEAVPP